MKKHVALFSSVLMMSTTLLGAGSVFAESVNPEPNSATTSMTAELTLDQTATPPTPPVQPGEGGGDEGTNINGLYGIAYVPKALSGNAQLNENGSQDINLANNSAVKYNVGVQDKTRKNDQEWTLKAQLNWSNDTNKYMAGATIKATNGKVTENKEGELTELANDEVTTAAKELTIKQGTETEIMKSTKGKTMNGVYNYQFDAPKLNIPDVSKVAAGTYSGTINWNLENTPAI